MILRTFCLALLLIGGGACSHLTPNDSPEQTTWLTGVVSARELFAHAKISVFDAAGEQRIAMANAAGVYQLPINGLKAPLILSAIEAGENDNCLYNHMLRAPCMAAVLGKIELSVQNTANINPWTDRIASDVAVTMGLPGPQQLVEREHSRGISAMAIARATRDFRTGFEHALAVAGMSNSESFDPVTWPVAQHDLVMPVLQLVHHNRNYHNDTGLAGHTVLTDISFRPIVGLFAEGRYEPLDFPRAERDLQKLLTAERRIFIVGDSTAANYENLRAPRMGWGQVFADEFAADASVAIVNGARAGRSSRDFFNGGWFRQMEAWIRPGDYIVIHHGHNDQNCNSLRPVRGAADVANLCTYPNSPPTGPNSSLTGRPQFPVGQPEMSFQRSLERYIAIARKHGARPILMTPTARVRNAQREKGLPVVHSHFTQQNSVQGFAFVGDYSATIRTTAQANLVPLIDIELASRAFANQVGESWRDYWLVVNPEINSYYANNMQGSISNPDTTHFQERGARAIAAMVARGIKETPELATLARRLKR